MATSGRLQCFLTYSLQVRFNVRQVSEHIQGGGLFGVGFTREYSSSLDRANYHQNEQNYAIIFYALACKQMLQAKGIIDRTDAPILTPKNLRSS